MELLAGSFDLSDAVLIAVMGWMIRWSYRDRRELREEIRAGFAEARAERQRGFAEAKAEREQIRDEARAERQRGFAEAKAEREQIRDEAKAEREQIREEARAEREQIRAEARAERGQIRAEAAETNKRLVWIGEQVAWMRGRHDYALEEPVAQQAAPRG